MARYTGSLCRLCRRESEKLFLKGDRCFAEKCAVEKRKNPPGQHVQPSRSKLSDYGKQLREKQKIKRMYSLMERQFRKIFHEAERSKGVTGEILLQLLERRLDNVAYRMGFSANRRQARQFVTHGHLMVNNKPVNIPSYVLKAGDVVGVREGSRKVSGIQESMDNAQHRGFPEWVEVSAADWTGKVLHIPAREELQLAVQEQLVVELYSK